MNINQQYISERNSYSGQIPRYIVIHNTDNYSTGADARAHAMAQYHGNFDGYSAHVYVDDKSAYQAMPYSRGAWHVGVNYGGRLFGTVNNRNSVGIEMCVQAGFDYDKAFANTAEVCRQLMSELNIPADRVVQHYDVCAKNCPSAIRAKNDWNRFKKLTQGKEKENSPSGGKEITLTSYKKENPVLSFSKWVSLINFRDMVFICVKAAVRCGKRLSPRQQVQNIRLRIWNLG